MHVIDLKNFSETFYSRQAIKAFLKGDKQQALRWAYLSANRNRMRKRCISNILLF